ncbi:hypothetical protein [Oharaeibacter diazotrophicus]|uniref:Peptidase inhibitor I9 n=1 Tax=Oharaeibacter diazotrophicus TaxID=1920512 RepID=A0A4V3CWU4_9HYPH|nr:hypothetical protein [Oharaeibacter diazotrophicus]TDP87708.1 hypothetical protein EDD54_1607 [Oharaeibacter diazotrophicus]BBE74709.1 hypothetical protein OHA_1_04344 [Pleomorphomonas sp. SM30]GLS77091.1 hypothetical protein GCM10007904_24280 [Oharaeibacter diazotrophicus]
MATSTTRRHVLALAAAILATTTIGGGAMAADGGVRGPKDILIREAQRWGTVRIIVILRMAEADKTDEAKIRSAQDAVLMRAFGRTDMPDLRRHTLIPSFALDAKPDEIERLFADPDVAIVQVDGMAAPN